MLFSSAKQKASPSRTAAQVVNFMFSGKRNHNRCFKLVLRERHWRNDMHDTSEFSNSCYSTFATNVRCFLPFRLLFTYRILRCVLNRLQRH